MEYYRYKMRKPNIVDPLESIVFSTAFLGTLGGILLVLIFGFILEMFHKGVAEYIFEGFVVMSITFLFWAFPVVMGLAYAPKKWIHKNKVISFLKVIPLAIFGTIATVIIYLFIFAVFDFLFWNFNSFYSIGWGDLFFGLIKISPFAVAVGLPIGVVFTFKMRKLEKESGPYTL